MILKALIINVNIEVKIYILKVSTKIIQGFIQGLCEGLETLTLHGLCELTIGSLSLHIYKNKTRCKFIYIFIDHISIINEEAIMWQ